MNSIYCFFHKQRDILDRYFENSDTPTFTEYNTYTNCVRGDGDSLEIYPQTIYKYYKQYRLLYMISKKSKESCLEISQTWIQSIPFEIPIVFNRLYNPSKEEFEGILHIPKEQDMYDLYIEDLYNTESLYYFVGTTVLCIQLEGNIDILSTLEVPLRQCIEDSTAEYTLFTLDTIGVGDRCFAVNSSFEDLPIDKQAPKLLLYSISVSSNSHHEQIVC